MKTITLHILAEDIISTDFLSSRDCAITRALNRAKIDARHTGFTIEHNTIGKFFPHPEELADRVIRMYSKVDRHILPKEGQLPEEPQDFEFQLEVPDNW